MTREELIKKVALKMDEISSSDDVIVSVNISDNNPLYTQINQLLNESINEALAKVPVQRIADDYIMQTGEVEIEELYKSTRAVAMITYPNDFLRFVSIDDIVFQRPIVELAVEGDEVSKNQHNKFLVAKYAKPVGVISRDGITGGKFIKCYSYDSEDTPRPQMTYVKRFDGDLSTTSTIKIDEYLSDIVAWICAGRVYASRGDSGNMQICDNNAVALMV